MTPTYPFNPHFPRNGIETQSGNRKVDGAPDLSILIFRGTVLKHRSTAQDGGLDGCLSILIFRGTVLKLRDSSSFSSPTESFNPHFPRNGIETDPQCDRRWVQVPLSILIFRGTVLKRGFSGTSTITIRSFTPHFPRNGIETHTLLLRPAGLRYLSILIFRGTVLKLRSRMRGMRTLPNFQSSFSEERY